MSGDLRGRLQSVVQRASGETVCHLSPPQHTVKGSYRGEDEKVPVIQQVLRWRISGASLSGSSYSDLSGKKKKKSGEEKYEQSWP